MNAKGWYQSKTLWINIIGFVIVVLSYFGQVNWLDPKLVAGALTIVNFILRLVTTQAVI